MKARQKALEMIRQFDDAGKESQVDMLREYREVTGLTNGMLAAQMNVSKRVVEGWSSGRCLLPGSARRLLGLLLWLRKKEPGLYSDLVEG